MEPANPKIVFTCFHQAGPLPRRAHIVKTTKDGTTQLAGLCRTCHYSHVNDKLRLAKEKCLGKIKDRKSELAKEEAGIWKRFNEELATASDGEKKTMEARVREELTTADEKAKKAMDDWTREMRGELSEIVQEFDDKWGE